VRELTQAYHSSSMLLELFRLCPNYEVSPHVRIPSRRNAHSDSDLNVTYRQGTMAYSVLVECKDQRTHRIRKGVSLISKPDEVQLELKWLFSSRQGRFRVASPGVLATYPHLHHFTLSGLQYAIQSGQLDDMLALLANANVRDDPAIAGLVAVVRASTDCDLYEPA